MLCLGEVDFVYGVKKEYLLQVLGRQVSGVQLIGPKELG